MDVLREQTGFYYPCKPTDSKQKGNLNSGCTKTTQMISSDQTGCQTMAQSRLLTDSVKYSNVIYSFVNYCWMIEMQGHPPC